MKLRTLSLSLALASTLAAPAGAAENPLSMTELADGIHLIEGAGGNVALVVGPEASFLVDDKVDQVESLMLELANEKAMEATGRPVDFILNTHLHGDHTGSNSGFAEAGSWVVAHHNVRSRMAAAEGSDGSLPVITFSEDLEFHINGLRIRALHMPEAHTDGDSVVLFEGANLVHMGDVFFNQRYPFIDVDNGGHVDGVIAAVEDVMTRIDADTIIIPGHGPVSNQAELTAYRDLLVILRDRVADRIAAGDDLDAILDAGVTAEYDEVWTWGFIDSTKITRAIYRSLTER